MPEQKPEVLTVHVTVDGGKCKAEPPFVAKRKSEVFFDIQESIRDTTTFIFEPTSPFEKDVKHGKNKVKDNAAHLRVTYTVKYTGPQVGDGNGSGEVIQG